uniref:GPCR14 n=1 Tax=Clytia hemisphaerica TaxID=252671 RepID=A0A4P2T0A4_9CNID|nr:GPCR14 [Clytia hemisphaerica]
MNLGTTPIILIIILISVLIIGLTGNVFIFYVIFRSRKLQRHPANFFIASLNICNIGVLLTSIPLKIHAEMHHGNFCFSKEACSFYNFIDLAFHVSSVTHLWVIAIERFIAIKAPFHHRHRITRRFTIKVLIVTWLYSLFWILLSFVKWQPSHHSTHFLMEKGERRFCILHNPAYMITLNVLAYLLPIIVMAFLYGVTLQNIFHPNNKKLILSSLTKNLGRKKEAALTKTVAIIYTSFVFCWLPAILISFLTNQNTSSIQIPDSVRIIFLVVMPTIPMCAFPIIYVKHSTCLITSSY